ncbi:MAG: hypothetical protein CSA29_05875 [Desulfobacterales bacterium]|nr:MAG: hypothetical protein CSA29_05875 [Desulfobacterales bacterium]
MVNPRMAPLAEILIFYSVWVGCDLTFYLAGLGISNGPPGVATVFIVTMLLVLSSLSRRYRLCIEPYLESDHPLRILFLSVCILIFIAIYCGTIYLGLGGILMSSIHAANLLFFACVAGHWLTLPLRRPAELIPLCIVMSMVDVFSVFKGPTKEFTHAIAAHYNSGAAGRPPMVDFILVKLPLPGMSELMPVFGVVDWILIVMLSGAAAKFDMNDNLFGRDGKLYFSAAALGLVFALLAARGAGIYLPALPMIAVCFFVVVAYRSSVVLKLSRNELPAMILAGVIACGVLIAVMR